MKEARRFVQVVMGARQIGKSTVVDGCPSDRQVHRGQASASRFGYALSVLFCRQCSGHEQCLGFRLLGGRTQLEGDPGVGECHPCN